MPAAAERRLLSDNLTAATDYLPADNDCGICNVFIYNIYIDMLEN